MKQLILYFLFFVAAALILVQCARYFPSEIKPSKLPEPSAKFEKKSSQKLTLGFASTATSISLLKAPQKKPTFRIPVKEPSFTLKMVNYINRYQFFGNQYFGLYNDLINARHLFDTPREGSFSNLLSNTGNNVLTADADINLKK